MNKEFKDWCSKTLPTNLTYEYDSELWEIARDAYNDNKLLANVPVIKAECTEYMLYKDGAICWIVLEIARRLVNISYTPSTVEQAITDMLSPIFDKATSSGTVYSPKGYIPDNDKHTVIVSVRFDQGNVLHVTLEYSKELNRVVMKNVNTASHEGSADVVEQIIGDKISAIIDYGMSYRAGNLYDLWCLLKCTTFNLKDVIAYLQEKQQTKYISFDNMQIAPDYIYKVKKAYDNYQPHTVKVKPSFAEVMDTFTTLVNKIKKCTNEYDWDCSSEYYDEWTNRTSSHCAASLIDKYIGEKTGPFVLAGEYALQQCGLVNLQPNFPMQGYTLKDCITGVNNPWIRWYFNPWAEFYKHTMPSPVHKNILVPSESRAIIECIMFSEQFDERIIIMAIQAYAHEYRGGYNGLYSMARELHLDTKCLDKWVHAAGID